MGLEFRPVGRRSHSKWHNNIIIMWAAHHGYTIDQSVICQHLYHRHTANRSLHTLSIMAGDHPNAQLLLNTAKGFDHLFSNDIDSARTHFQSHDDPFSLLGTGICAFLEAALGMEVRSKTSFLSNETMFYHSGVSWQKRHAALSSLRLARDNACEFPNPEIWHIMVVSNTDWSGRY
jgi:hypothetical protein